MIDIKPPQITLPTKPPLKPPAKLPPALKEGDKRIRPDILQTMLLDEIIGRLEAVEKFTEQVKIIIAYIAAEMERVPEGLVYSIDKTITGSKIVEYDIEKEVTAGHLLWFSCTIYNRGPDSLWVAINTTTKGFTKIDESETFSVDFHSPKVKKLYFYSTTEGTCLATIVGER